MLPGGASPYRTQPHSRRPHRVTCSAGGGPRRAQQRTISSSKSSTALACRLAAPSPAPCTWPLREQARRRSLHSSGHSGTRSALARATHDRTGGRQSPVLAGSAQIACRECTHSVTWVGARASRRPPRRSCARGRRPAGSAWQRGTGRQARSQLLGALAPMGHEAGRLCTLGRSCMACKACTHGALQQDGAHEQEPFDALVQLRRSVLRLCGRRARQLGCSALSRPRNISPQAVACSREA